MPVKKIYTGAEIARYESCAVRKYDYQLICNLFSVKQQFIFVFLSVLKDEDGWVGMYLKVTLFHISPIFVAVLKTT